MKITIILIGIVRVIFFVTCPPLLRQQFPMKTFYKRAEYERRFLDDYLINSALYESWSYPQSICNVLMKRFSYDDSAVVAFVTESLIRHAQHLTCAEIKNEYGKDLEPRLVSVLECKLSTSIENQLYIHFLRSPTQNCKFLLLQLSSHDELQYRYEIADEICYTRTYSYKLIMDNLRTSGLGRSAGKWTYKPTDKEILKYELNHIQLYSSTKDTSNQTWPDLRHTNIENYCRILIHKLGAGNNIIRVVKSFIGTLELHYSRIRKSNGEEYPPRIVIALHCWTPHPIFSRQNYHKFIRAFEASCAHEVRQCELHKYFITSQICEKEQLLLTSTSVTNASPVANVGPDDAVFVHEEMPSQAQHKECASPKSSSNQFDMVYEHEGKTSLDSHEDFTSLEPSYDKPDMPFEDFLKYAGFIESICER